MFGTNKLKSLFKSMLSVPVSPMGLGFGGSLIIQHIENRDIKLKRRIELYEDPFTRNIVSMVIERSCGGDTLDSIPYEVKLKGIENEALEKKILDSIEDIHPLIQETIGEMSMDAQIMGDGYSKLTLEPKKGLTKINKSIKYSPLLVTPIIHYHENTIKAYRVLPLIMSSIFGNKKSKETIKVNGITYYIPTSIGHMSGKRRTLAKLTTEQYMSISENELKDTDFLLEDGVYGGVCDEVYEDFLDYKYAIKALANTRISSSVLERFITHDLDELNEDKKNLMVSALQKSLQETVREVRKKVRLRDTIMSVVTHIVPSTNGSTGGVSIQDSQASAQGLNNIEDIMFMIKKYCVSLGFPFTMTEFGDDPTNGMQKDTPIQQSILLETHAKSVRESIGEYIQDLLIKHIAFKHGVKIKRDNIEILFSSSINHAKALKSAQTVEVLNEVQQFMGIIDTLKMQMLKDTKENRDMVSKLLSQSTTQDEKFVEAWVDAVFTPLPDEDGGDGNNEQ